MARDFFHNHVKVALVKDGWTITHDPYSIKISEIIKVQIDLGAESAIAAQRNQEKIAIGPVLLQNTSKVLRAVSRK